MKLAGTQRIYEILLLFLHSENEKALLSQNRHQLQCTLRQKKHPWHLYQFYLRTFPKCLLPQDLKHL